MKKGSSDMDCLVIWNIAVSESSHFCSTSTSTSLACKEVFRERERERERERTKQRIKKRTNWEVKKQSNFSVLILSFSLSLSLSLSLDFCSVSNLVSELTLNFKFDYKLLWAWSASGSYWFCCHSLYCIWVLLKKVIGFGNLGESCNKNVLERQGRAFF